jgi:hypothetical protein
MQEMNDRLAAEEAAREAEEAREESLEQEEENNALFRAQAEAAALAAHEASLGDY